MNRANELNSILIESDTKIKFYSLRAQQYNDDIIKIEQRMKYENGVINENQTEIKNYIDQKENLNSKQKVLEEDLKQSEKKKEEMKSESKQLDKDIEESKPLMKEKTEDTNVARDKLVSMLNQKGAQGVISGIYQSPVDTVSTSCTINNGKIVQVGIDPDSLKDGDNYLTMNTGTRLVLPEKYTVSNNFAYENATYHSTSERTASPITVYKGG